METLTPIGCKYEKIKLFGVDYHFKHYEWFLNRLLVVMLSRGNLKNVKGHNYFPVCNEDFIEACGITSYDFDRYNDSVHESDILSIRSFDGYEAHTFYFINDDNLKAYDPGVFNEYMKMRRIISKHR